MSIESCWMPLLAADQSQIVLDPGVFALLIPITAIVLGFTVVIAKSIMHHRERMAKIGMGIDPDAPKAQPYQSHDPSSRFGG
jgi:hypothetical protein